MITLGFTGADFVLSRGVSEADTRIHLTQIRTDEFEDTLATPDDDVTITAESTRTPHDSQWVNRPIVLGSRMVLVAPMHYSARLTADIINACRTIDAVENQEMPLDGSCPFYQGVVDALVGLYAPAKALGAMKDDFSYILAYMPAYQTAYRTVRSADPKDTDARREAARWIKRPVYMLRENAFLWDSRRRMANIPHTLDGRLLELVEFGNWNDLTKST